MQVSRGLAVLLMIGACADSTAALAQQKWTTYVNERYGAAADYPTDLFTQKTPEPDAGDGQTFRTADGEAKLSIYGSNNIDNDTPESYLTKYVDLEGIAMKRVTAHFYAVSGTHEGKIYYERCNFPPRDGPLGCFYIEYPVEQKATWAAVVTRIGRSLRAGSP